MNKNLPFALGSSAVTVILGGLSSKFEINIAPNQFLGFGIVGFALLNVVFFIFNLIRGFVTYEKSGEPEEIEERLAPVIQGKKIVLGSKVQRSFQILIFLFVGEIVGSIVLIILVNAGNRI